jgi:hypothetical protein
MKGLKMEIERRFVSTASLPKVQTRQNANGQRSIVGYASVFYRRGVEGTEYFLADDIVERIHPGAFNRALSQGQDVAALFNHDASNILGRNTSGTLKLTSDSRGLAYEIEPAETTVFRDVVEHLRRGDVRGSSFAFTAGGDGVEWSEEDGLFVRNVKSVRGLYDVGPVTFPAYSASEAGLRSLALVQAERDQWVQNSDRRARQRLRVAKLKLMELGI